MRTTNITIGGKDYQVLVADTTETRTLGLRNKKELADDEGMLFVWDKPQNISMTMEDTLIPLDLIFINENNEVVKVAHRKDTLKNNLVSEDNVLMVLELNINSGITEGDELEEFDNSKDDNSVMRILAPDGSTLMELWGGERIFSRKNTKVLIRLAKKAYLSKIDADYKRLGKSIFKYLSIQDSNDPLYVQVPD